MIDAYKRHISSNAQLMTTMTVFYLFSYIIFLLLWLLVLNRLTRLQCYGTMIIMDVSLLI